MKPVGYLVKHPDGLSGETGLFYNYILASNGLFIKTESAIIAACIPVAECEVRGLAPMETKVTLTYGSIPQRFWDLALDIFLANPDIEHYVAVTAVAGYNLYVPVQDNNSGGVTYEVGKNVVLDLHSHGVMGACFSPTDNSDEKGLKLYGVVGKLNATPIVKLRIGVYGYFKSLAWGDVFDGSLTGATEFEREEVITEDDVHCNPETHGFRLEDFGRRMWWNRWLRR
ncbi:hypothetical protein ES703_46761 [subsurface metagenome]